MIRSDDAGVMISGNTNEIMFDFIMIIRSVRTLLSEDFSGDIADRVISDLGKMAYLDPKDDESFDKIIAESPFMERRNEDGE